MAKSDTCCLKTMNWRSSQLIYPVWPDLAKFTPLTKLLNTSAKILRVYLVFGEIFVQLGKFSFVEMVKFWANNLAIWSHCHGPSVRPKFSWAYSRCRRRQRIRSRRPVWPGLAKFRHFVKNLWAIFWIAYLAFGTLLSQLWHFYATRKIVIVVNGQRLNSNNAIWSHCRRRRSRRRWF